MPTAGLLEKMQQFCSLKLINSPFGDPGLFISFSFEKRAIMFDLGDIHTLSAKDILKISHVFVSHTHIDHFFGFDRLLRIMLGRDKDLYLFGPEGFIKNVEGKLSGYCWNLVKNYSNKFIIHVKELTKGKIISRRYECSKGFTPIHEPDIPWTRNVVYEGPSFSVSAAVLDHKIACLGFVMREKFRINIIKERLIELNLATGPWLNDFKQALYKKIDSEAEKTKNIENQKFEFLDRTSKKHKFILKELARKIAIITPGKKIAYISDVGYTQANIEKIARLAKNTDHIFIEAAFLDKEKEIAIQKQHLTAKQAGIIAKKAGVKKMTLFHFSPRYTGEEKRLIDEALLSFELF